MKDVKYIGIRGHRGSGKNTIAYLLGCIIQWIIRESKTRDVTVENTLSNPVFSMMYRLWCDDIKNDETSAFEVMDAPNIYMESFGDTPRVLLQLITNIPSEYFSSDYYKDHVLVHLNDFQWRIEEEPIKSVSAEKLIEIIGSDDNAFDKSIAISLRDFIIYFAKVCMKYLGQDVWVKSMRCSDTDNSSLDGYYNIGTQYKIFRDIKAPSELSYVKDHGGIIIKVERPEFKKKNKGVESLQQDDRWDYEVVIHRDVSEDEELKNRLVEVAFEIM